MVILTRSNAGLRKFESMRSIRGPMHHLSMRAAFVAISNPLKRMSTDLSLKARSSITNVEGTLEMVNCMLLEHSCNLLRVQSHINTYDRNSRVHCWLGKYILK